MGNFFVPAHVVLIRNLLGFLMLEFGPKIFLQEIKRCFPYEVKYQKRTDVCFAFVNRRFKNTTEPFTNVVVYFA